MRCRSGVVITPPKRDDPTWQAHTALKVVWAAALLVLTATCATAQTIVGVFPTSLTFDAQIGGPAQESQTVSVVAVGPYIPLSYTVTTSTVSGGNWLSATPGSGATPSVETVSVNTAGLAVGTYTGLVTVSTTGAGTSLVAVTLTVVEENQEKPIVVYQHAGILIAPPCVTPYSAVYNTIGAAVSASTTHAGATILVCPGNYGEQITINKTLTLQGVANPSANAGAAVITVPAGGGGAHGGLANNGGGLGLGTYPTAVQVLVQAANVNLIDLGVDGAGAFTGCSSPSLIGIAYAFGSSGTLRRVAVRNQNIPDGSGGYCPAGTTPFGTGILAEGGNVTVQDSSIRNFSFTGFAGEGPGPTSFVVKGSAFSPVNSGASCISITALQVQVSDNTLTMCEAGLILAQNVTATVSGNTIVNVGVGIDCECDLPSVVNVYGNTIAGARGLGILFQPFHAVFTIQHNHISGVGTGIAIGGSMAGTVTNNTINDASVGISGVTGNTVSNNTFLNVTTLTQ